MEWWGKVLLPSPTICVTLGKSLSILASLPVNQGEIMATITWNMMRTQRQQKLCALALRSGGANIDRLLQAYLTCHTLNYVFLFSSTTTLSGKSLYLWSLYYSAHLVFLWEIFSCQWLFLSAISPWKIAPGWVLPKGKLSPLARQEGKCKDKPWPTITKKSTVEVSHLPLATGLDLVINERHLRLIPFLAQVLKIKALGNVSPENEQKRRK